MTLLKKDSFLSILIFICGLLMPFILYWNLFVTNQLFVSTDGVAYLPCVLFVRNALLSGEIPFWNPYLNNGIPFISDVAMGPFYLPTLILSFLPLKFFVYTMYGFHVAIAGFFSFKYFRCLGCCNKVAFLSAFLYMFSIHHAGYRKEHIVIISAAAYIPAVMYAIEGYFLHRSNRYLCLCSLFMGLQFFSPFIQLSAYTYGSAAAYYFLKCYYKKYEIIKALKSWMFVTITYLGLIAIQLLPTLEMLSTYKKEGTIPETIEYFKAYSISLYKLVMMVFPNWFNGNIFEAGGAFKSSGIDIELFCGICVFAIFAFSIIRYFKYNQMKIFVIMMGLTLIYAAHSNIPYLSNVLFAIPGVNGFRCPARILFIFFFFVYSTFAYGLNCLLQKNEFNILLKYVYILIGIMVLASLTQAYNIAGFVFMKGMYIWYKLFGIQILSAVIFLLVLHFSKKEKNIGIVLLAITIITLVEVIPYDYMHGSIDASQIILSNGTDANLHSDVGNSKIWDAYRAMDAGHTSIISHNKAMSKEMAAINAYIPFNIPTTYKMFSMGKIANFNYSGLTIGSLLADNNVHLQNHMLSMLGIKYIIDSSEIIKKGNYIDNTDDSKTINIVANRNFLMDKNALTTIENIAVPLISNTIYRIEFDYDISTHPQIFDVDLFGGNSYDYPETQVGVYQGKGKHHVVKYINSGIVPRGVDTYVRLIAHNSPQIIVDNFRMDKCYANRHENFYQFYGNIEGQDVYLNPTYKEILYTVPNLIGNVNKERLYSDIGRYDFLKESYVEDEIPMLEGNNAVISVVDRTNNTIKANVISEKKCFVNFSQNYYPGWHAYVNGKETNIYLVNGVIQGVILPAGNNILEFKYKPTYLNLALIIFSISLLVITICAWKSSEPRTMLQ